MLYLPAYTPFVHITCLSLGLDLFINDFIKGEGMRQGGKWGTQDDKGGSEKVKKRNYVIHEQPSCLLDVFFSKSIPFKFN